MPDVETTAMLRTVLDELCAGISPLDARTRTSVASKLLEAASQGTPSIDDLREVGRVALRRAPTMWR